MATPTTLPASFVSGAVLTAAQLNDLRGAFRVLQVVQSVYGDGTATTSSSSTYADTGMSASITPSATSSKILIIAHHGTAGKGAGNTGSGIQFKLLRGSTDLIVFEALGGYTGASGTNIVGGCSTTYLDSPNTTSATTYKTQFRNVANAASVEFNSGSKSTITLFEISA